MTCDFTSFSTVIQSYQDDVHVIRKGCVQWNPVYDRKDPRLYLSAIDFLIGDTVHLHFLF